MSRPEVEERIGQPEEVAEFDQDFHLYYWSRGISLFFSADEGGLLSGIEVNSYCPCILNGEIVFPKNREQTVYLIKSLTQTSFSSEGAIIVHLEDEGTSRIAAKDLGMDFYFSPSGHLESINWAPL